jgi:hypothetical protein
VKALAEIIKENYHTFHGQCGLDVAIIVDSMVRFAMQSLACKLLRKCRKDQVPTKVITAAEQCVEGF